MCVYIYSDVTSVSGHQHTHTNTHTHTPSTPHRRGTSCYRWLAGSPGCPVLRRAGSSCRCCEGRAIVLVPSRHGDGSARGLPWKKGTWVELTPNSTPFSWWRGFETMGFGWIWMDLGWCLGKFGGCRAGLVIVQPIELWESTYINGWIPRKAALIPSSGFGA